MESSAKPDLENPEEVAAGDDPKSPPVASCPADKKDAENVIKEDQKPLVSKDEDASAASGSSKENDLVDSISHFFKEKLGLGEKSDVKKAKKILPDKSLEGIVKYIQEKNVTKIVTMAGAGISTSAGIPDFRSPGTGLYNNLAKYNLPHPQAVFDIDFFQENPKPFFALAKELYPGSFKPTISHYFVKMLHEKGLLMRHYTQNIDTLERVSGLPGDKIVEAHGTFHTSHCLKCEKEYELAWMQEKIFSDVIPKCDSDSCEGVVKPDIVFFGENLPAKFFQCLDKDFDECELLIVLGTSLVVQPFASLVDKVGHTVPRLLINREKAGEANPLMRVLGLSQGMDFASEDSRDVAWLGDCDAGCEALASALGWADELKGTTLAEHEKIDKEKK